ncbi:hypothetical protein MP228_011027 [Amoeboaphelidium protococcarum]|nr:hypothetical protein MP228_011027 [Amoeboaphelidium protococcarum]
MLKSKLNLSTKRIADKMNLADELQSGNGGSSNDQNVICPICQANLSIFKSQMARQYHIESCMENSQEQSQMSMVQSNDEAVQQRCIVCNIDLTGFSVVDQERHVNACLDSEHSSYNSIVESCETETQIQQTDLISKVTSLGQCPVCALVFNLSGVKQSAVSSKIQKHLKDCVNRSKLSMAEVKKLVEDDTKRLSDIGHAAKQASLSQMAQNTSTRAETTQQKHKPVPQKTVDLVLPVDANSALDEVDEDFDNMESVYKVFVNKSTSNSRIDDNDDALKMVLEQTRPTRRKSSHSKGQVKDQAATFDIMAIDDANSFIMDNVGSAQQPNLKNTDSSSQHSARAKQDETLFEVSRQIDPLQAFHSKSIEGCQASSQNVVLQYKAELDSFTFINDTVKEQISRRTVAAIREIHHLAESHMLAIKELIGNTSKVDIQQCQNGSMPNVNQGMTSQAPQQSTSSSSSSQSASDHVCDLKQTIGNALRDHVKLFIKSQNDLYEKILTYQQLELNELHQKLADGSIKCSKKALQQALDTEGIHYHDSSLKPRHN